MGTHQHQIDQGRQLSAGTLSRLEHLEAFITQTQPPWTAAPSSQNF